MFVRQLGAGQKVVVQRFPVFPIQFIDGGQLFGILQSPVSQELAHVRPVLLLHVPVVIFLVGPGAGEANFPFPICEAVHQVVVEELAAVVAIEPQDHKGQPVFDILSGGHDPVGHRVGFQIAGPIDVPVVGPDRDLRLQQGFEAFAAGLFGCSPDPLQHFHRGHFILA